MYCPDVVSLKQFYTGPLGQAAYLAIWNRLRRMWPPFSGESVLGLGYATPYFSPTAGERDLTVAGMPAAQGALYWPVRRPNRVALLSESQLPFADSTFNRILVMHLLEHTDYLPELMQEVWRVLMPGGRILAVVPNRLGLWSHSSKSPFGYGRPFSIGQMREVMSNGGLTFTRADSGLYFPPTHMRGMLKAAGALECTGRWCFPRLGGVLLVEAEKQIYAALKQPARAHARPVVASIPAVAQPAFSPSASRFNLQRGKHRARREDLV